MRHDGGLRATLSSMLLCVVASGVVVWLLKPSIGLGPLIGIAAGIGIIIWGSWAAND